MKRNVVAALFVVVGLFAGCKDKDTPGLSNCGANAEKVTKAGEAWAKNQSVANCETYKKEIVAFIKSCPTYYSGVTKQQLEDLTKTPCD